MISYATKRRCRMKDWKKLYEVAKENLTSKEISPFISVGNKACAILSEKGNIYYGLSIDSSTGVNNSAEKSAITNMLNNKEFKISKIVVLNELEEIIMPCSDCLEYLLELSENNENLEILVDLEKEETTKLVNLLPEWWGTYRKN